MSAIITVPFNFQPVNAGQQTNGTYTVPAGKYARLIANLSTSAYASSSAGGTGEANSLQVELWLKSGDVVTVTNSPASGVIQIFSESISSLKINSQEVAECRSVAHQTTGTGGINFSGTAKVNFRYEEFNNVS